MRLTLNPTQQRYNSNQEALQQALQKHLFPSSRHKVTAGGKPEDQSFIELEDLLLESYVLVVEHCPNSNGWITSISTCLPRPISRQTPLATERGVEQPTSRNRADVE